MEERGAVGAVGYGVERSSKVLKDVKNSGKSFIIRVVRSCVIGVFNICKWMGKYFIVLPWSVRKYFTEERMEIVTKGKKDDRDRVGNLDGFRQAENQLRD